MNATAEPAHSKGRFWFILAGVLTLLAGFAAMACPLTTSIVIAQIIGAFSVVSGVFLLASAIFGKTNTHRILDLFSALLRMALGVVLLLNVLGAVLALTLLLAAVFLAEGIVGCVLAFRLKGKNPAWGWVLANAVLAIILGVMLFAKWPSDAAWAIGLLFGINCVFVGVSLIMYGLGLSKAQEA
ncbi:MAG: DUF308 domain-containing protein [Terrimicrobiaceae bacterium]|nr:DUF308 domain-containing protein [Terrimicrobiaceae bacterium]